MTLFAKHCLTLVKTSWKRMRALSHQITVEPLMLCDGLAFSIMTVFIEDLQMRRICEVGLNHNATVCSRPSEFHEVSNEVQSRFSVFAFYDGIIKSIIPLFFILFMGAWSDKYGRKIPLYVVQLGHVLYAASLLVISTIPTLPVEYMLIPTLLDSLGGGNVCFLTAANAYLSDVTSEASRTSRVGLANSIFFLGGPLGTFLGRFIYELGSYQAIFGCSLVVSTMALLYVLFWLEESHGPYATIFRPDDGSANSDLGEKVCQLYGMDRKYKGECITPEKTSARQMMVDFISPQRIIDSFRSTFKPRLGNTRAMIIVVIICTLVRRLSKSPYVYAFTRHALSWRAEDYSMWVTYKNLVATLGSLVAVPVLSGKFHIHDYILGIIGASASLTEYLLYGLVLFAGETLFWIAPLSGLLVNSCSIALRAMLSKFVESDELGKVSAVIGALDGVMPMVNFAVYMIVYKETVTTFSGAHFFVGVAASTVMIFLFGLVRLMEQSRAYDVESAVAPVSKKNIVAKSFVVRQKSGPTAANNRENVEALPRYQT